MIETASRKCGENTRAALIEAGIELFGEYGFKGTTTRMLASRAGANISAIPYYFTNKKGLYIAVIKYIVDFTNPHFKDCMDKMRIFVESGSTDKVEAGKCMKMLLDNYINYFLEKDESNRWLALVTREHTNPTDGFDAIYNDFIRTAQEYATHLVSIVMGKPEEDIEVKINSHSMFGQPFIFVWGREKIFRQLDVKKLEKEHLDIIRKMIFEGVDTFIERYK